MFRFLFSIRRPYLSALDCLVSTTQCVVVLLSGKELRLLSGCKVYTIVQQTESSLCVLYPIQSLDLRWCGDVSGGAESLGGEVLRVCFEEGERFVCCLEAAKCHGWNT